MFQYCEFWPEKEKCIQWLQKNLPDEFSKLNIEGSAKADEDGGEEKKKQKRGKVFKFPL
jgi:density-regulated protein